MSLSKQLIDEIILIESELSKKYGCSISLKVTYKKFSLSKIKKCCDVVFKTLYPGESNDISFGQTKQKVFFRNCYYKICKDNGYSLEDMAYFIDKNHATAIHGIRNFNKRVSKENLFYINTYNRINDMLLMCEN